MGIGVEEAECKDLFHQELSAVLGDFSGIGSEIADGFHVIDIGTGDEFHDEQSFGGEFGEDGGDMGEIEGFELRGATLHGAKFGVEIEFAAQASLEFLGERDRAIGV